MLDLKTLGTLKNLMGCFIFTVRKFKFKKGVILFIIIMELD